MNDQEEDFSSERERWDFFRGPKNRNLRRRLWRRFYKRFPSGHDTSLRNVMHHLLEMGPEGITQYKNGTLRYVQHFPPNVFAFLAEFGVDYTPVRWHQPPVIEPEVCQCFENSLIAAEMGRELGVEIVYVEGFILGGTTHLLHHGWNAAEIHSRDATDWTHYAACHWNRYLGFPLTLEEHSEVSFAVFGEAGQTFPIFHPEYFAKGESALRIIAEARQ